MTADPEFWSGKRVFLTGHTGFKGSWMALWLQSLGAIVKGYALSPPTLPNLFEVARVGEGMESQIGDIRDLDDLCESLVEFDPEIVIHMAAQPLVRLSYREPVATYAVNVMGTVHLLEACREAGRLKAVVCVTTDKCYENREWAWGYRENEPMGGHDPYSNSKGCAELVTAAYRSSFFGRPEAAAIATGRAGNVIGGGDWAEDRLVPDLLKAFERGRPAEIRNPLSTRPWQHVLEPLSGYLALAQALYEQGHHLNGGWNFGPADEDVHPVETLVEQLTALWGEGATWVHDERFHPHEARELKLDISKARQLLRWRPVWHLRETLERIVDWQKAWLAGRDMRAHCLREIGDYSDALSPPRLSNLRYGNLS